MKNYTQEGNIVEVPSPAGGCNSGDFLLVGALKGVAQVSAPAATLVPITRFGVFNLPKVAGTAFVQGDQLFWDAAAKNLTKVAAGNTAVAIAWAAAQAADAVCQAVIDR